MVVDLIRQRSPLHKKRLDEWLATAGGAFHDETEIFSSLYFGYLSEKGFSIEDVVDAYLDMCNTMLKCQMAFLRTGSYPRVDPEIARQSIYTNPDKMLPYMVGLALSQFLWSTHYQMFEFYKKQIKDLKNSTSTYLEIGPGHGLYMRQTLIECDKIDRAVAVDISDVSLRLTREILTGIDRDMSLGRELNFMLGDVNEIKLEESFDLITMGEVLEHVERPGELLNKIYGLLRVSGRTFISTCANCPMIDHVCEFNNVSQIRELVQGAGLAIIDELAIPAEHMTVSEAEEKRVTINYCAILEKKHAFF